MKLAVITGTSRGIGRATALALAERGFRLALVGRSSARQQETQAALLATAADFRHFECDLGQAAAVEAATGALLAECGTPEVIIHNAGVIERAPLAECTDESWQRHMDVNVTAPFRMTRALLPRMLEQQSGRILYVASISAVTGTRAQVAYNASKWALLGLMKCLAEELSDTGLMTCALLPGSVDTDMLAGSGFPPRMAPEEVARTLCFYAADASPAHNGAVIEMFGT